MAVGCSSPVCFFFISFLSAAGTAGGVGQKQVAADDLPRSGGATRGGDPGRADCRFARPYHPLQLPPAGRRLCSSPLRRRTDGQDLCTTAGGERRSDMGSARSWNVELPLTQAEPLSKFVRTSLIKPRQPVLKDVRDDGDLACTCLWTPPTERSLDRQTYDQNIHQIRANFLTVPIISMGCWTLDGGEQ